MTSAPKGFFLAPLLATADVSRRYRTDTLEAQPSPNVEEAASDRIYR